MVVYNSNVMNRNEEMLSKNIIIPCSSFVITVVVAVLIFAKLQILPQGKFTLLTYDLAMQDLPFITSLRYVGNKDCSFLYSMLGGLGVDYLSQIAYYLASPLYIVTPFIPLENMPEAVYFITLLKLGLCSVSFSIFILYGLKPHTSNYSVILLSIIYALSSYNVFYCMTLKLTDGVIMLPLILLGVEIMLKSKKSTPFIAVLTIALYTGYYTTYMSGIFSCLYLVYRIVLLRISKSEYKRIILLYSSSSLISLGLSMPILLPTLKYMAYGKLSETAPISESIIRVTPLRILLNLFPAGEYFIRNGGAPQIYCGIITIVLVILFFISKNHSKSEKGTVAAIILLYLLSFLLVPLDRIWHGFRDPVCFPARYSYTFICFMLIIACRVLDSEFSNRFVNKIHLKPTLMYPIILVITIIELYFNGTTAIMEINNNSVYMPYNRYLNEVSRISHNLENISDDSLYRIESAKQFTSIDGFMFGYNDISFFSSVYNSELHAFLKSMGLLNNNHSLSNKGLTPIMSSVLGVKYQIGSSDDFFDSICISEDTPSSVYYNPYALPIGFMSHIPDKPIEESNNPFINHELLINSLLNDNITLYTENDYSIIDTTDSCYARSSRITLSASNDGPVFVYFPIGSAANRKKHDIDTTVTTSNYLTRRLPESKFRVNGSKEYDMIVSESSFCVYIGDYKKGDNINISSHSTTYYDDPYIVTMDVETYRNSMKELAKHPLYITSHGNGVINGTVQGVSEKKLILTLPYLNGYRIYLDGNKTDYREYNPAMIAVDIPEGNHTIRISYLPPGLVSGIIIGIVSMMMLISYVILSKKQNTLSNSES